MPGFVLLCGILLLAEASASCNKTSSANKQVQDWFRKLGDISKKLGEQCSMLPSIDTTNELERRLAALAKKVNKSDTEQQMFKRVIESQLTALAGRVKILEERPTTPKPVPCKSPCSSALASRIRHGSIKCQSVKEGHLCKVTCDKGSFVTGSDIVKCSKGYWDGPLPTCTPARSCLDYALYGNIKESGIFHLWSRDDVLYEAYCDMTTDKGGWTLAAIVANGDAESWTYLDPDKDYGDTTSLWENDLTYGTLTANTSITGSDYKGKAYMEVAGNEILISLKGKPYIQTSRDCLGGNNLKLLLNVFRFTCKADSMDCTYGKCLGTGAKGVSTSCHHACPVARFYKEAARSWEPLAGAREARLLYVKAGTAEKNDYKRRVYFSTYPFRDDAYTLSGLGVFKASYRNLYTTDMGTRSSTAESPSDKSLFYGIYVR